MHGPCTGHRCSAEFALSDVTTSTTVTMLLHDAMTILINMESDRNGNCLVPLSYFLLHLFMPRVPLCPEAAALCVSKHC